MLIAKKKEDKGWRTVLSIIDEIAFGIRVFRIGSRIGFRGGFIRLQVHRVIDRFLLEGF